MWNQIKKKYQRLVEKRIMYDNDRTFKGELGASDLPVEDQILFWLQSHKEANIISLRN